MTAGSGLVEDLAELSRLDEEGLNIELQRRFLNGEYYTYIGDILIAVNPYKPLKIYDQLHCQLYKRVECRRNHKPHIFAVADAAYYQMLRNTASQCCIVSGESGAGKTESVKLILRQIVATCETSRHASDLHRKLIELNPLLEAFGNAKTSYNDNSSRFGKYIELEFGRDGALRGGSMSIFLLEKTRVTACGPDELNFHIFYHMFAGLNEEELKRILLDSPDRHRILRHNDGSAVFRSKLEFKGHQASFLQLIGLMNDLAFTKPDKDLTFSLLSTVLHLTDIDFQSDPDTDGVFINDEYPLHYAAQLLGVSPESLTDALISNISIIRGEQIVSLKNLEQANDGRDAIARLLYARLFAWIVGKLNATIQPPTPENSTNNSLVLGLLDIAGFENFRINRFEQLCINVANEQLQFYFNQHVFASEIRDLEAEGVGVTKSLSFTNNTPILNMFMEKPLGFYALLDEESKFPKATNQTFLDKTKKHLHNYAKRDIYKKEKGRDPLFSIHHYAGWVKYNASSILEKNRDTVSSQLVECMNRSQSRLVQQLFSSQPSQNGEISVKHSSPYQTPIPPKIDRKRSLSRQAGKRLRQSMQKSSRELQDDSQLRLKSAGSQFVGSLMSLNQKLQQCQPHFVRCIKPNHHRSYEVFDEALVRQQLKYTGILETVKIRQQGFPVRLSFREFIHLYKFIRYALTARLTPDPEHCAAVLRTAKLTDWQIGHRKVFLKYHHPEKLQIALDRLISRVVRVQAYVRRFLALRRFRRKLAIEAERKAAQVKAFFMSIANISSQLDQTLQLLDRQDLERKQAQEQAARDARELERRLREEREKRQLEERLRREQLERERVREIERKRKEEADATAAKEADARAAQADKRQLESEQVLALAALDSVVAFHSDTLEEPKVNGHAEKEKPKQTWKELKGRHRVADVRNLLENNNQTEVDKKKPIVPPRDRKWIQSGGEFVPNPQHVQNGRRQVQSAIISTPLHNSGRPVNILTNREAPGYESSNQSHYARQTSSSSAAAPQRSKQTHYHGLIQDILDSDILTSEPDAWALLVYMERSQRCDSWLLTSARHRIDGAKSKRSASHIAINSIRNPLRDAKTAQIREHVGNGLELSVNSDGIWAKRLSINDVTVHEHHPELSCASAELIKSKGSLDRLQLTKVFDIAELRAQIILELHRVGSRRLDTRLLASRLAPFSLSLVKHSGDEMNTPCWLNVVSLTALRVITDPTAISALRDHLQYIMRSNIDLRKISKLPQLVQAQLGRHPGVVPSSRPASAYTSRTEEDRVYEKRYASPAQSEAHGSDHQTPHLRRTKHR